jgi:PKD repeat protein
MQNKSVFHLLGLFLFLYSSSAFAQSWVSMLQKKQENFYTIQKKFHRTYAEVEKEMKRERVEGKSEAGESEISGGWMQFRRWENFMAPRVYPSGEIFNPSKAADEYQAYLKSHSASKSNGLSGNWISLGSPGAPLNGGGAGRVNNVRFDPKDPNTLYVCAPAGGLWKTTDAGSSWSTNTDYIGVIGVTDIAIHPDSTNILYIATGDGEATDTYSLGVLKSTDAGVSWFPTGLAFKFTQTRTVAKLLMHPNNPNILFAGANNGLYKTTDGGMHWTKVLDLDTKDIEFKPGNPNIVFAVTPSAFYMSTDAGNSFVRITTGLPSSGVNRMSVAVTNADSNYVYVLAGASSGSGLKGLYLSTNGGISFTKRTDANTPNIMGWDQSGGDTGGQSWYTLALAVSPDDKNFVITGGVNIWMTYDGGLTWSVNSDWTGGSGNYVHADIHALQFLPGNGSTYYASTDGGVFMTTNASTWTDISGNLSIGQMYKLGCSKTDPDLVIQGWQDNGTGRYDAGSWDRIMGGDGMECFIDHTNTNYMYAEYYDGALSRSSNGGQWFSGITSGLYGTPAWVTPWVMDPVNPMVLYCGYQDVFKSINRGSSWNKISSFGGSSLVAIAVAPSNTSYIYAASGSSIYRTTNGGTTWTKINSNLPVPSITYIAINNTNPDNVWVTYSGFSSGNKVFKTTDGGASWTNVSGSLPNLPVNCIVYQNGGGDGLYIGTDIGVYYTNNTLTDWKHFSSGLPNVIVSELEIQYSAGKLRAATYGRGLWETDIFDMNSLLPAVDFASDKVSGCPGMTVQFTDKSTNNPTSWLWKFPGGNPSSSTDQNPIVVYNTPATYNDVKLIATNANGTDSLLINGYVTVSPAVKPDIIASGPTRFCEGGFVLLTASSLGTQYNWSPGGQLKYRITVTTSGDYSVSIPDAFGCWVSSLPVNVTVDPNPVIPVITTNSDTLVSSYLSGNQWYVDGTILPGDTSQEYVPNQSGTFSVVYTDTNGCSASSTGFLFVGINEKANASSSLSVIPNPSNGNFILSFNVTGAPGYSIRLVNLLGDVVYNEKAENFRGQYQKKIQLPVNNAEGVYLLILESDGKTTSKKVVIMK